MGDVAIRPATAVDAAAIAALSTQLGYPATEEAILARFDALEASRGRKIGATLVAAAEAWARERGHGRMRVRSNVLRQPAHRFYERLGYAVTKRQAVFDKSL